MGDVDRSDAERLLELPDLGPHLHADLGVEVRQRLVEEEDVGVEHERSGEGDPLLLAAGELARVARLEPREVHLGEALLEAPGDRRGVELPEPEPVGDVRPHGHVGPERVVLEDHPDVALVGPEPVHAPLAEPDFAGVRSVEPRGQPKERRLATARGPEQREELPVGDFEGRAVHGGDVAERLGDPLQQNAHRRTPRPAPRTTITLTPPSRVATVTASSTSSGIGGTIVFSESGRFRVIVAVGPSTANKIVL